MIGLSNNLQPRYASRNSTKAAVPEYDFVTDLNSDLRAGRLSKCAGAEYDEMPFSDKVPY
jgi:hypothetical protein